MPVSGWLFDAYALADKMVFWVKSENGKTIRLEDDWSHSIYVAADYKQDLLQIAKNLAVQRYVKSSEVVSRYEKIRDDNQSQVLKLTLKDSRKAVALANLIEDLDFERYRLYNVDIFPPQAYFYEHDLYPLARGKVSDINGHLTWNVQDDLKETDYDLPDFRIARLDLHLKQEGRLPKFSDKIGSLAIKYDSESILIERQDESDAIADFMGEVRNLDPDFIFTIAGDEFVLPYLTERAKANKMQLVLDREGLPVSEPSKQGITYFSYGRVHYRPSTIMLHGRVHIDSQNSFILDHSALHGLYEVSRVCRMPFHICARATIGRCLSSLQMYHAFKRNLLVPYKPVNTEKFKTFNELLLADRGGLIFEPIVGVHENVAEFDFTSLYPNIMSRRNVSGETVNCSCCPDSDNLVKELGYHICKKRQGIVSQSLELPLDKRARYKELKKSTTDKEHYDIYHSRQDALKWLGVVSFGYLGHANSKFGLIDSHIVVCAIDREVLLEARDLAEEIGFTALHGIVDSLWIQRKNASREDYTKLEQLIKRTTGYDISYEGAYKWIVFLASKQDDFSPVPNRYFGVFEDGTLKDRGIETRRRDTPPLFSRFQHQALAIMGQGNTIREVKALMPRVRELFLLYKERLLAGNVPFVDLVFTKSLSKDSDQYSTNTVETSAIYQLRDEGDPLRAGEQLQYIISDYRCKNSRKRTVPIELLNEQTTYDAKRYVELLAETCSSITKPFGFVFNTQVGDMKHIG